MLTVEKFKARLERPNHPDWLFVGVDSKDENPLYLLSNDGLNNINCATIEQYAAEIKNCVLSMVAQGELHLNSNEKPLRIGQGRSIYSYTLKSDEDLSQAVSQSRNIYFSSLFIRWQRTYKLSDERAREMLGLTAKEFHQFREDELEITQDLINKLAEVTGSSRQIWQNRWKQK
tara:strand:+ start:20662 stop:21183 length:522 start_codon:yes stop_codon:yes gene_type:complete